MDKPLDVLVITPTDDEFAVCEKVLSSAWARSSKSGANKSFSAQSLENIPLEAVRSKFKAILIGNLAVGLFRIGGQGNLNASLTCYEVLNVYRPKAVFLTGIAAGKSPEYDSRGKLIKPRVRVGDVICNGYLVYSSFGKTFGEVTPNKPAPSPPGLVAAQDDGPRVLAEEGKRIQFEYRKRRYDVVPHAFMTDTVLSDIVKADDGSEDINEAWQSFARGVFESFRAPSEKAKLPEWKGAISRWSPLEYPHPPEDADEHRDVNNPSKPHIVDVASGEMVIADSQYQDQLREAVLKVLGNQITIQAFEMEAYGIARVCYEKNIPFLTVRGISDPGDGSKEGGVDGRYKDADHLAAACLGAAYTRRIIQDDQLQTLLSDPDRRPKKQRDMSTPVSCLDPKVSSGCPHFPAYQCLNLRQESPIEVPGSSKISLVNVYEGLDTHEYSTFLSDLFQASKRNADGVKYHVLLLYPYTAEQTIQLCEDREIRVHGKGLRAQAESLIAQREAIRDKFGHFAAVEDYAKLAAKFGARVDRVILGKGKLSAGQRAVYAALLGDTAVRTFFKDVDAGEEKKWNLDDMVVIKTVAGAKDKNTGLELEESPTSFRYFARSKMLVIRGWRCGAAGGLSKGDDDFPTRLVRDYWPRQIPKEWSGFAQRI